MYEAHQGDAETALKYLCLVFYEEATVEALPAAEHEALLAEARDYRDELRSNGQSIASSSLQSIRMASTIRVRQGRLSVTDGPCAETREQLSEFYVIHASDLNHAIRVAAKMPSARIGCVEVRPLLECCAE